MAGMRPGLRLLLVELAMSFLDHRLYCSGGNGSLNGRSLLSEMYAALRAGMALSCLSLSIVTRFQTGTHWTPGGPRADLTAAAGAGVAVGLTFGCLVRTLTGADTLGSVCGHGVLPVARRALR